MARSPSRNPLAIDPEREQRVRERAYHLWEADGKPHGRDVEYWERARELVGMEESAGSGLLPNPQNTPDLPRETGIEEASIQENLGEFPDRLADQGDVQPTPSKKSRLAQPEPAPATPPAQTVPVPAKPSAKPEPASTTPPAKRKARARPKKPT